MMYGYLWNRQVSTIWIRETQRKTQSLEMGVSDISLGEEKREKYHLKFNSDF